MTCSRLHTAAWIPVKVRISRGEHRVGSPGRKGGTTRFLARGTREVTTMKRCNGFYDEKRMTTYGCTYVL
jgi:hypothetical protein